MHAGVPLTDEDRWPWLDRLNQLLRELEGKGHSGILACSALRERYRERLARGCKDLRWVHLKGSFELIYSRMQQRKGHYMPASLLQSQFDTLEPPAYGTVIDIADAPEVLAARIRQCVATDRPGSTEQVVQ
jgi:gluconokinase